MKVQGSGGFRPVESKKTEKKNAAGSAAFSSHLKVNTDNNVQESSGVQAMAAVDTLLSVQENNMDADREANRHAMMRGNDLLDQLEGLRNGLVNGRLPMEQIERLMIQVQSRAANVTDPQLQSVLKDIELRAAVELAKMEKEMETMAGQS